MRLVTKYPHNFDGETSRPDSENDCFVLFPALPLDRTFCSIELMEALMDLSTSHDLGSQPLQNAMIFSLLLL